MIAYLEKSHPRTFFSPANFDLTEQGTACVLLFRKLSNPDADLSTLGFSSELYRDQYWQSLPVHVTDSMYNNLESQEQLTVEQHDRKLTMKTCRDPCSKADQWGNLLSEWETPSFRTINTEI